MEVVDPAQKVELKEEEKNVPYSEKEKEVLSYLQTRLMNARTIRNQNHDEFDGMSYTMYYQSNLMGGNSYIAPKKNKEDVNFTTGTTRQALLAYVSKMNALNLSPEVKAFDRENNEKVHVGHAIEDAIMQANELDNDEEKRILREYEMFMQGTVFVQESWTERFQLVKKGFDAKKWDGKISSATWTERLEKVFAGCTREIIPGLNMYLGRISEFDQNKQPYIFSVDYKSYEDAKQIYGQWERWKYVTRKIRYWSSEMPSTLYNNNWRLENTQENVVEEIIYQDKWSNEFVIILNGVMMTPVGFPMPWNYGEYNIVKQVFEMIATNFAYGGSLIKRLKVSQQLEDEFWRLAILKTHKSFQPPRGNISGQVIGSRVFMPGKITPGITKEMVPSLDDNNVGITQGEVEMMQMMKQNLRDNSIPDLNQAGDNNQQSATEIMMLKRQADILMGMALFSCSMLEKKLSILRMFDVLENWYEPYDEVADVAKMEIKKLFRTTSRQTSIAGVGRGRRMTKVTSDIPEGEDIYNEEEEMGDTEGQPVRIIYINPDELKKTKYSFFISVNPREKESSELSRIMFGNMLDQAVKYFQQDMQLGYFEEKFAEVWNLNSDKAFAQKGAQQMQLPGQGQPSPMPGEGAPAAPNPVQSQMPAVQQGVMAAQQQQNQQPTPTK